MGVVYYMYILHVNVVVVMYMLYVNVAFSCYVMRVAYAKHGASWGQAITQLCVMCRSDGAIDYIPRLDSRTIPLITEITKSGQPMKKIES